MKQFSKELGKVSITPKGDWNSSIANEKLDIVYDRRNNQSYIAKQDVPIGVDIDNREYWQPLNVSGYADNNFINLITENKNGTITAYESLEEALTTIFPINRRVGATLSFYNLNSNRLDRQAEFELWQFNSTDLANWENKDYWNNIYYNWNVFAGWYIDADALTNHVEIPNVGQYAYVGPNLNDALLYQCRTNGTWTNTGIKARNYISVVVSGNITIGENGNWFSDGEDTGIPATPAVDEQLDNIITKHESLSRTVQGIAATGGASTATNVTYNNDASGLNAENAQDAIDEVSSKLIYDVSAHNNGTVFESLQSLLSSSNLSTLIPTSVRHGGMTIRFIQSSHNRYVQYILMSNTFSTNESDWQGVDDEPTDGSNNLIKSGGVFSSINTEVAKIENKINDTFINVSYLYPTDGFTNSGETGGDQYSINDAIQLLINKGLDNTLRAANGLIFVNKETQKWELWEYTFYTKIDNNYKAVEHFRKILSTYEYDTLNLNIEVLRNRTTNVHLEEMRSINLAKEVLYKFFNSQTGVIEAIDSNTPLIVINLDGIKTNDIYISSQFSISNNTKDIFIYDKLGKYLGGVPYDVETSTEKLKHFIIPDDISKCIIQYVDEKASIYTTPITIDIPYGIEKREYEKLIDEFSYLGESIEDVKIDISYMFTELKKRIYLKAGLEYTITSDYPLTSVYLIDIKGERIDITLGTQFKLKHDCFYIYAGFVNTKDSIKFINFHSTIFQKAAFLKTTEALEALEAGKTNKTPFSIVGEVVKIGTLNNTTGVITDSGTDKISEYVPIIPKEIIYVFPWVNTVCFYNKDKKFIGNGTAIKPYEIYKSPANAYYMVWSQSGYSMGSKVPVGFVYHEEDIDRLGKDTILALCNSDKTRFRTLNNNSKAKTVYVIGDSEAAKFRSAIPKIGSLIYCASTSFGGQSDDAISSGVCISTTGNNLVLTSLEGAKVIVQAATNGGDIPRSRAYQLELVRAIREKGATEIWGMSNCMEISRTYDEFKQDGKHRMLKTVYGGHFIDYMEAVYNMGLYYNLYHPKQFIQPNVGENVDIYFDTITPFIEFSGNPIFGEGLDFYMQYYDDKYDIYTVVSIDEENNKITATLKTNNSDVAPGSDAGQYIENVEYAGGGNLDKTTKGFIYNEADKNNVAQNKLPYNIYFDHTTHFGLILAAIIKEMLFAAGVIDNMDNPDL